MTTITNLQYESLVLKISDSLFKNVHAEYLEETTPADEAESQTEAERIVDEWMEENNIQSESKN